MLRSTTLNTMVIFKISIVGGMFTFIFAIFSLLIVVQSLLVEPKNTADTHPTSDMRQLFSWTTRFQPQATSSS